MHAQLLGLAMLFGQPDPRAPVLFINAEISRNWQAEKITPAERASDFEYLRRATLDIIGRIPTLEEQASFEKDPPKTRRTLLLDRLLAHEDYARHWADVWSDWLLNGAGDAETRTGFHRWMKQHFARNGSHKELAEKIITAKGSFVENPAAHFLSIHKGIEQPKKEWTTYGQYDMVPATGQLFRIFHAKRIQCVHCHDHPFNGDLSQHDFFCMNIFFRQVRFDFKETGKGKNKARTVEAVADDPMLNKLGLLSYERRNGIRLFLQPKFYNSAPWKPDMKQSRREFFAEHFVKHPDFARGYVNFVWAHLFGHGLTESHYDDMGAHYPVVHKQLMNRLATEFVKSGHDQKAFLRWLCSSDVYHLKSVANKTNDHPEKAVFFGRMQARPLSRRQLAESLIVALTLEDYAKRREVLRKEFLRDLIRDVHWLVQECEIAPLEADSEGRQSIQVALWLINGDAIQRESNGPNGTVAKLLKKHGATQKALPALLNDLFRITLCRAPTQQELKRLTDPKMLATWSNGQPVSQALVTSFSRDVFWALLNTAEFSLNH